jgi:hypothetical protein
LAVRATIFALAISLAPATGLSPQAASIARAAEGKPVDKSRARYASGTAFFRLEKYGQALREFELGYLDRQDPAFLFNIAQCHRELHHPTEAVRFYRRFLSEAPEDHPSRGQAEQAVRELEGPAPSPSSPTPEWQVAPPPARAGGAPEPQGVVVPLPSAAPAAPPPGPAAVPTPAPAPAPPGVAAGAAPEAAPSSPATPVYKTWWFWTLIGAGVVGGILIGVAASSGNTPLCPTGRMCL